jgi:hypothetical protein
MGRLASLKERHHQDGEKSSNIVFVRRNKPSGHTVGRCNSMGGPMTTKNGSPWDAQEVQLLRSLAEAGLSAQQIAEKMSRTPVGIRSKAAALKLALRTARRRAMAVNAAADSKKAER